MKILWLEFWDTFYNQGAISNFCSSQGIQWDFIPQHGPHFGGLWEAAVKRFKNHLRRVAWNLKLTFEEMCTVLSQIEACLNSCPLTPLNKADSLEVLTPGHSLIGRALEALPDSRESFHSSLLRRWHLCQSVVRHFWKRWSDEYLLTLRRFHKWHHPTCNLSVGDIVLLREDNVIPAKWPIGQVLSVYPGEDGLVRVVTVRTSSGTYRRPVVKLTLLLLDSEN